MGLIVPLRKTGRSGLFPVGALAVSALLCCAASGALAAGFAGAYGSKEGCRYARTGEASGADDFALLTSEGLTTSTAVCTFAEPPKKTADGFAAEATCEAGGEAEPATIRPSGKGYTLRFADGTSWGPLPKCR